MQPARAVKPAQIAQFRASIPKLDHDFRQYIGPQCARFSEQGLITQSEKVRPTLVSQSPVPRLGEFPHAAIAPARTSWPASGHHVPRHRPAVTACDQPPSRPGMPGGPTARRAGAAVACQERRGHTGDMGRVIGTILGAILAIWLVVTFAGGIFATLKMFVIIGLIAMAVFIVVWLVAGRRSGG